MSNYLWDRSGEPDEEIQKLEEILAPLRYQPRPLEMPATVAPERRRRFFPALAIAATIALAALALGLWFTINRNSSVQPEQARQPATQNPDKQVAPQALREQSPEVAVGIKPQSPKLVRHDPARRMARRSAPPNANDRQLGAPAIAAGRPQTEATEAEGEVAKEQLMTALRLASTKLNHAQKRARGVYPENPIRYQHKVG